MHRHAIITAVAATVISTFMAAAPRVDRTAAEAGRAERKADMVFLEALRHKEQGDMDAYADLVGYAAEINPTDPYIGFEYGRFLVAIASQSDADSADVERGYRLMYTYAMDGDGARDFSTVAMTAATAQRIGHDSDAREMMRRLYRDNPDRPEAGVNYAQLLASTGRAADLDEAIAVFDTIEAHEGGISVPLIGMRLKLRMMQGDTTALINDVRRYVASSPKSSDNCVLAGDVFGQLQMPDSALAYYNRAIELDPSSGIAYYSRANHYLMRGDSTAYDREIFMALEQPDLDVETKTELMRDYVSNLYRDPSQKERIVRLFNRLLEAHPHEAAIHGLYGSYLATMGDYGPAAEQIDYQISLDPSDAEQWRMLGSLYYNLEDYEKTASTALKAMELFPDDNNLPLLASEALTRQGKADEAIGVLHRRLDDPLLSPDAKSDLLTAIGDALYRDNRPDSAFVYYEQAISLNPVNYLAMNNCAYFMACSDLDLDRALALIQKAVDGRPDDPTTLDTYAWVLFKRREYDKAREIMDKTLELSGEGTDSEGNDIPDDKAADDDDLSAEMLEHAGDIYFMVREPDKALAFWKRALDLDPDNELLRRKVTHKTYFYE